MEKDKERRQNGLEAGTEMKPEKSITEGRPLTQEAILAKNTIYDSVFTNLFRIPKYTLELYRTLHPEDKKISADQIEIVTLENVLLNQPYNDLGFVVGGDRLILLVEAQSTWSENILVRVLVYAAQTIQQYIVETKQNVYGKKNVVFPEPEFYVVFTGGDKEKPPQQLSLRERFFGGRDSSLEVRVKVICGGEGGNIIDQYVAFTKIYREQYRLYGRTQKAVMETIRICKDRNVLREYLESREKEVVDIMMTLFNQEYALERYTEEIREEGRQDGWEEGRQDGWKEGRQDGWKEGRQDGWKEGRQDGWREGRQDGWKEGRQDGWREGCQDGEMKAKKETALALAGMGLPVGQIAEAVKVSVGLVKQWLEAGAVLAR